MPSEVSNREILSRVNTLLTTRGDKAISWEEWVDFREAPAIETTYEERCAAVIAKF